MTTDKRFPVRIAHLVNGDPDFKTLETPDDLLEFTTTVFNENEDFMNFDTPSTTDECLEYIRNWCGNLEIL